MEVTEVRVRNYKSIIDSGWVSIESGITTLLGKNESGKTSFLQGIRYFGEDRKIDRKEIHDGAETTSENKFPIVSLKIELNNRDAESISSSDFDLEAGDELITTKYSNGTREIATLQGKEVKQLISPEEETKLLVERFFQEFNNLRSNHGGNFRNHYDNKIKSTANKIRNGNISDPEELLNRLNQLIDGVDGAPEQHKDITIQKSKWLDDLTDIRNKLENTIEHGVPPYPIPNIVYHGEFDTISDSINKSSIESEDHRTFRNLLEIVDLEYEDFENRDIHERNKLLDDAGGTIRGQVNSLWEQKEVDVDIRYADDTFTVGIKDESLNTSDSNNTVKKRVNRKLKRPSERSKGFQWFFSFYVNLMAETENGNQSNQLILLDDPAVFLHPEGKKNWLSAIEKLSDSAQIIYSSHSPFLIRKEYPNRIRVVEDREDEGTIVTEDYHTSDEMTLEPLRNALGIGLGDSPFVSKRKILVEGISDYEILIGVAHYFQNYIENDILNWSEITVMPTNGGNNMTRAAKWVASEDFSYVLLLDNDQKGKEVSEEIERNHQEIQSERIVFLSKDDNQRDFNIEVEDMFSPEFYIDCLNSAYSDLMDDFEEISIKKVEDGWLISDQEYKGRKIVNRVEEIFDDRGLGDLDKLLVANEIQERLRGGEQVSEEDVSDFKPIFGKITNLT